MTSDKPGFKVRVKSKVAAARERFPLLDHLVLMVQHYGKVHGNVLAGAVTYFGFLSFFPILALGFAVIGYIAIAYPDANDSLVTAIQQVLPNIVTVDGADNTISIQQIADVKVAAGLIGFAGVLYSGLGWLSGLRDALTAVFELPPTEKRNLIVGKGIDLTVLAILGLVMVVSVGISGAVTGLAGTIVDWVGVDGLVGDPLVYLVGVALGLAASTFLFFVMYRLLAAPDLPAKALWQGALLGAIGFEALKYLVVNVLGGVGGTSFAPLAIAITLVVWINYFSRLVMFGASWAITSKLSREAIERRSEAVEPVAAPDGTADRPQEPLILVDDEEQAEAVKPDGIAARFDPGSAIVGAAAGVLVSAAVATRRHR